jgi:hypothetical protein
LERERNFGLRNLLSVALRWCKSGKNQRGGNGENLFCHGLSPFSSQMLGSVCDCLTVELRSLWRYARKTTMHSRRLASELRMNR